jgi:hypothetical protein
MKLTITSTSKIVHINGVPASLWEGKTESGVEVICFVTRVAVRFDQDQSDFERELTECAPPSEEAESIPSRLTI